VTKIGVVNVSLLLPRKIASPKKQVFITV